MSYDFNDYLTKHLDVCQRMLLTRYPNIHDEATTVKLIIEGIKGVEEYKGLARDWISTRPMNIRSLKAGEPL